MSEQPAPLIEEGVRCEGCGKPGTSFCKGCRDACTCKECVARRDTLEIVVPEAIEPEAVEVEG